MIEQAHISARLGPCPRRTTGRYHRVRVLLGLDQVRPHDESGNWALQAREAVLKASDPARELEHQLREMACLDGLDLHPIPDDEHSYGWFPYEEEDAAVVLAEIDITLHSRDDCWEFDDEPVVRPCVRTTLLPTDVITSLTAGLAPGLLSLPTAVPLGPQVHAQLVHLDDDRKKLIIPVTASLVPGTVPGTVEVTTLDPQDSNRWVVEDIHDTSYDASEPSIVVRLAYSLFERPPTAQVRVRIRGTGSKPVMGDNPLLPLAGVSGWIPDDADAGHDAVCTFSNYFVPSNGSGQPPQLEPSNNSGLTAEEVAE